MQGLGRAFDVEETRVESAEPFHVPMVGAMTSPPIPIGANYNKFRDNLLTRPRICGCEVGTPTAPGAAAPRRRTTEFAASHLITHTNAMIGRYR